MGDHERDVGAVRSLVRLCRLLERAAAEVAPEVSLAHYRVLAAVADGDERASRVAARLALGKPAISASVDALCRRGLLQRAEVSEDQRAVALQLTAAGERLLTGVEERMADRLGAVLAHARRPAETAAALARVGDAVEGYVAGAGVAR